MKNTTKKIEIKFNMDEFQRELNDITFGFTFDWLNTPPSKLDIYYFEKALVKALRIPRNFFEENI